MPKPVISKVIKPSLKSAGMAYIKSLGTQPTHEGMMSLARSMNRPRASTRRAIATVIESAQGHISASEVYANRKAQSSERARVRLNEKELKESVLRAQYTEGAIPVKKLSDYTARGSKPAGNLIIDDPRFKVYKQGGGWARVEYKGSTAGGWVKFHIREKEIREIIAKSDTMFWSRGDAVYSKWIQSTDMGQLYTHRRQVEGMLKVAIRKSAKDPAMAEMATKLEALLKKSDKEVAEWHQKWLDEHTKVEKAEYYDYKDVMNDEIETSEAWS